jgi:hypothetical protein
VYLREELRSRIVDCSQFSVSFVDAQMFIAVEIVNVMRGRTIERTEN